LRREALALICHLLRRERTTRRGRSAGALARYQQDMHDLVRHSDVVEARAAQHEFKLRLEQLRATRNVPASMMKETENMHRWAGHTWLRAYECAAMLTAGTKARASPDTIKKSYMKIERLSSVSSEPFRYLVLNGSFLRRLGIDVDYRDQGRKGVPLFDLTLDDSPAKLRRSIRRRSTCRLPKQRGCAPEKRHATSG
jgi:hypothetical protein